MARFRRRNIPYSIKFDGSAKTGAITALAFASSTKATVIGWLFLTPRALEQILFEGGDNPTIGNGIRIIQGDGTTPNQSVIFASMQEGTVKFSQMKSLPLANYKWYRICVTVDETLGTRQCKIYINGTLGVAGGYNDLMSSGINTHNYSVGGRPGVGYYCASNFILSRLVKGQAYTAAEALDDYDNDYIPTGSTILAEYKHTEGSGVTVADSSGNGFDITLTAGTVWSSDTPMKSGNALLGQNFILRSQDFSVATWIKQAGFVITGLTTAPDGTNTANTIDMSAAGAGTGMYQVSAHNGRAPSLITRSIWLKGAVGGEVVTIEDAAFSSGNTVCVLTTSWKRFSKTSSIPTAAGFGTGIWLKKTSGANISAWGAQIVLANWGGNYTPTTTTKIENPIRDIILTQNLLANSSDITAAVWVKTDAPTITAGQADPEGGLTAFSIVGTTGTTRIRSPLGRAAVIGRSYNCSVFLRADAPCSMIIEFVDLADGVPSYIKAVSVTTSWQKFDVDTAALPATTASATMVFIIGDRFGTWPIARTIYVWQPQVTENTGGYGLVKTTGTVVDNPIRNRILNQNLLTYSEDFGNVTWTTSATTVATNTDINPYDGLQTADSLIEDGATAQHYIYQSKTLPILGTYTLACSVKAGTRSWCALRLAGTVVYFNLSGAGTVGTASGSLAGTPKICLQSNGFYRCTIPVTFTSLSAVAYLYSSNGDSGASYLGVLGDTAIKMFGMQLVLGNWEGNYASTVATAITTPIRNVI
jgi:hypothetical protein